MRAQRSLTNEPDRAYDDFREWVRQDAVAQGLPAEIEDPGIYVQLAEIVLAGRLPRSRSRAAS